MTAARLLAATTAIAVVLIAVGSARAFHTQFIAQNCNTNNPQPTATFTRHGSTSVALHARYEGYQWAGGCWNDNNIDDSPNDQTENASTGGEGGDCSGFTFKVWRESTNENDASALQWNMLRYIHGPIQPPASNKVTARPTSHTASLASSGWTLLRATTTSG